MAGTSDWLRTRDIPMVKLPGVGNRIARLIEFCKERQCCLPSKPGSQLWATVALQPLFPNTSQTMAETAATPTFLRDRN
jgi:hypothetical protein